MGMKRPANVASPKGQNKQSQGTSPNDLRCPTAAGESKGTSVFDSHCAHASNRLLTLQIE